MTNSPLLPGGNWYAVLEVNRMPDEKAAPDDGKLRYMKVVAWERTERDGAARLIPWLQGNPPLTDEQFRDDPMNPFIPGTSEKKHFINNYTELTSSQIEDLKSAKAWLPFNWA